jgi:type I restriction enzyme, S subunit
MSSNRLPAGWLWARVEDVCKIKYGKSLPDRARKENIYKVFGSSGEIGTHNEALTQAPAIILGRKGGIGLVMFSEQACWPIDTAYYIDDFERINPRYLFYIFCHLHLERFQSTTAIPSLARSIIHSLAIPVAPLSEQPRIADAVDAAMAEAEAATRAAEAQQADLGQVEFRLLEAAFPVPPLALEGGNAPDGWSWRLLTDVARLESGHTPSRRHPEWWGGETPWIALPDIRALDGRTAHETDETINDAGLANSSARLLPAGTVCLSRTASVGFVTVMGRPMATSQDFVNWVCGRSLRPWFLAYALMASRPWLRELASGAVHKTIYMPTLKALRICMPGIEEQSRVVARIECCRTELGAARDAAAAQRAAVERLPSAILTAAFEGRL